MLQTTVLKVFQVADQFSTTLLAAALEAFPDEAGGFGPVLGDDEVRWDPQTLQMEISQEVGKVQPDNIDRLQAAIELMTTDHFFRSLSDFIRLCNLLAFSDATAGFDPATVEEMSWACVEALLLRSADNWEPFHPEIVGYVAERLRDEGFTFAPTSLEVAFGDSLKFNPTMGFSEDPEMFAAVQGVSQGKTEDVDVMVAENLKKLQSQVAAAGFKNPVPTDWLDKMLTPS